MNKRTVLEAVVKGWMASPKRNEAIDVVDATSIATEVHGLFPKFEQIAFYTPDIEKSMQDYRKLGCNEWSEDTVTAEGTVGDRFKNPAKVINVARLAFNYQLGTELELIQYKAGDNWHLNQGRVESDGSCVAPFLSHMSYHVDSIASEQTRLERAGFKVIQAVRTLTHTSPYLQETGRLYFYTIFNTRALLGFDVKLIERRETK